MRTALTVCAVVTLAVGAGAVDRLHADDRPTLADAQQLFYNARYDEAAAQSLALCALEPDGLAAYELRTSALHFQLKNLLGDRVNKQTPFANCVACPALLAAFVADTARGRAVARTRLQANPKDETALFFLGKLDLNYVWLQLGTLGRRTGWEEYWEARRSLDAVLKSNPRHVRARVARAWIDYIVDTRMPRGTRWLLGGGSKQRALIAVRQAVDTEAEFFIHAEAGFALWNMHVREKNLAEAVKIARTLAHDFPDNRELAQFLDAHDPGFRLTLRR